MWPSGPPSCRLLLTALVRGVGAARGEAAPDDLLGEVRWQAADRREPGVCRGVELGHRGRAAPGCRGGACCSKISAVVPSSTLRPAYMTRTRSVRPAMTPMSWVMSIVAMPYCSRRWSRTSRIWAWIVTSSAVVGSSAIRSFGSQTSAIAIMTRCRRPPDSWKGILVQPILGIGHLHHLQDLERPRPALGSRTTLVDLEALGDLLADLRHGVQRRHGVLGDQRDRVAPHAAHLALGDLCEIPVLKEDLAAGDVAVAREEAHERHADRALPAPGLTDDAKALALVDLEGDAVDGDDRRLAHAVGGLEV